MTEIEKRTATRDMSKIRSESTIDFETPSAMLATNFSSMHEVGDDPQNTNIISFEVKPKSAAAEYVPSKVRRYIESNRESLESFFEANGGEVSDKLLSNWFSKFHVMQVSRKFRGKEQDLSQYSPKEFFNEDTLGKAISNLMTDT